MARNTKRLQAVSIIDAAMKEGINDSNTIIARLATEMYPDHPKPGVIARACYRLTLEEGFCAGAPALVRPTKSAPAEVTVNEEITSSLAEATDATKSESVSDTEDENLPVDLLGELKTLVDDRPNA
jgi:hypothetical protein